VRHNLERDNPDSGSPDSGSLDWDNRFEGSLAVERKLAPAANRVEVVAHSSAPVVHMAADERRKAAERVVRDGQNMVAAHAPLKPMEVFAVCRVMGGREVAAEYNFVDSLALACSKVKVPQVEPMALVMPS